MEPKFREREGGKNFISRWISITSNLHLHSSSSPIHHKHHKTSTLTNINTTPNLYKSTTTINQHKSNLPSQIKTKKQNKKQRKGKRKQKQQNINITIVRPPSLLLPTHHHRTTVGLPFPFSPYCPLSPLSTGSFLSHGWSSISFSHGLLLCFLFIVTELLLFPSCLFLFFFILL
jgi:hypothetical protein